ncbi:hypothetical protein VCHA47P369_70379 [Vibrio chagasii]|nr:hypothetical protein VCHA32O87_150138 [Vibrio chagasii]CAH6955265.1 hypothetical protein VCHA35O142_30569 [Vibrio chagasii]CAH6965499.1 hypothetical protein VCHA43P284_130027 [Vibrio chagasii]CAH6997671.1 hypothetical protein VCHA50O407_150121 [Vibrio chagasii]CAH7005067.1 hypothetical protein VCHA50P424_130123 [Vibrio chagasii]
MDHIFSLSIHYVPKLKEKRGGAYEMDSTIFILFKFCCFWERSYS